MMADTIAAAAGLPAFLFAWTLAPLQEFSFMRRALVGTLALAASSAPLGVLLTLRRMSLLGDALSHAVLPGVAVGFMLFGLSLTALSIGGFLAGVIVVAVAGMISRMTQLKEDASLAAIYLIALAGGVMLISRNGTPLDLLHILFGNVLGVDPDGLVLVAGVATVTLLLLASMYRGLLLDAFDPAFLAAGSRRAVPATLPDDGGDESGGRLPDPGHAHGRGPDDAAGGVGAPVARHPPGAAGQQRGPGGPGGLRRTDAVLSRVVAVGPDHHRLRRRPVCAVAAGGAARLAADPDAAPPPAALKIFSGVL
jgi:hypothetical protein